MTSPSPSEFLTFMRHASVRSPLRAGNIRARAAIPASARLATPQTRAYAQGTGAGVTSHQYGSDKKEHAVSKAKGGDKHNIQEQSADAGMSGKHQGGVDNATAEKDSRNSTAKAKKDHPEAPDVVIGMQDERGH